MRVKEFKGEIPPPEYEGPTVEETIRMAREQLDADRRPFICAALTGLASRPEVTGYGWNPDYIATRAIEVADAVIRKLNGTQSSVR